MVITNTTSATASMRRPPMRVTMPNTAACASDTCVKLVVTLVVNERPVEAIELSEPLLPFSQRERERLAKTGSERSQRKKLKII
eukprot:409972-Prorocentrum_minimum.AAC.1